jgi:hypothetical protein
MKIEAKGDSEDIRIYIDGLLHLRIPRDKKTKIHSWVEGDSKLYIIKIWCKKHSDYMAYDNKTMWSKILKLLDEQL